MKKNSLVIVIGAIIILLVIVKLFFSPKENENLEINVGENNLIEKINPGDEAIVNIEGETKGEVYDLSEFFSAETIKDQKDLGQISLENIQINILKHEVIKLNKKDGIELDDQINISENSLMNNIFVSVRNNGSDIADKILNVSLIDDKGKEYQSFINFEDSHLLRLKKDQSKNGSVSFLLDPDSQGEKLIFDFNGEELVFNFS
ncbi:MAG: hypothetical protein Q4E36_01260 [Bacillota bacterium]|nr:hypothetical protein [Bacillota bacterium]